MEMKIKLATFIFVVGTFGVVAAQESEDAQRILQRGLATPTVTYEGFMTVTHWYGTGTKSEEVHVRFSPPNKYRREFLKPDGSIARVVISDGEKEQVELVKQKKTLIGQAAKKLPKQMDPQKEWALLQKNYRLDYLGTDRIAGRPVFVITMTPLSSGKLTQKLWIDKDSGVILESKRFRSNGNFVVLSRYNKFTTSPSFDVALFVINAPAAEDHEFSPDFLSRDDLHKNTGRETTLPSILPYGFEFESADYFTVDGKAVDHFRYTDGLSVLSVFETASPVRFERHKTHEMCENGSVWKTKLRNRNYTVMGDVSRELMEEIFQPMK